MPNLMVQEFSVSVLPTALLIAGVSFGAWFFSMLAAGGSPLVLIPLLTLLLGPAAVAPTITVGMLVGNAQRSLFFWPRIDWRVTAWYLPGCFVGAILGAYALTQIQAQWLQPLIGIALLAMVLNYWLRRSLNLANRQWTVKAWYFLPVAFLNAVGSALIGSTGPVMNPLYLAYGLEKEALIATKSANKVFLHVVKLMSYGLWGMLGADHMGYGLVIGVAAVPANYLGKWVLERMTQDQFQQIVFAFVALSGAMMLWEQRSWLLAG